MMGQPTNWQEQTTYSHLSSLEQGIIGIQKSVSRNRNSPRKGNSIDTDNMNMSSIVAEGVDYYAMLNKHSGDLKEQSIAERENIGKLLPFKIGTES
jgi:hypothetical protein